MSDTLRSPQGETDSTMTPVNKTDKIEKLSADIISVPKKRWKILSDVSVKNNEMHFIGLFVFQIERQKHHFH